MKKLFLLGVIVLVLPVSLLSALGTKDTDEQERLNNEWLLCITDFNFSQLSSARRITGDVIARDLVDKLNTVDYRLRLSPEYAYYESYAWQQEVNAVAKAISNKQDERAQLLYRGEPDWRYRRNLKKLDDEIGKLREELAEKEARRPLIEQEPVFGLVQANIDGIYPAPPQPGMERRFCREQNADAILSGEIREFHGRYYIKLHLFALYTNSWVYEDDIIFSLEDTDGAVEEISARLTAALSGSKPSAVAVTVDPGESQVLINQSYAGRGTVEARDRPPGTIIIAAAAEGFMPETVETELSAGELVEVDMTLVPLDYTDIHIMAPNSNGAVSVYHGALYVGEAPLILRLPVNQLNYVTLEGWQGEMAKGVFMSPDMPEGNMDISFKPKMPPPGSRRVNKARKHYYWGWAGTWITGIATWVSYGIFSTQNAAVMQKNQSGQQNVQPDSFYDDMIQTYNIFTGALIALGVAIAYETFQMIRYLHTATEKVTPIVKQEKKKK